MAEIPRSSLSRYRKALDKASELAQGEVEAAFRTLTRMGASNEDVRDLMANVLHGAASKYGDIAAAAASEWYEELRPKGLPPFTVQLADTASAAQCEGSTRWAARNLWKDNPEQMMSDLRGVTQRLVEGASRDTISLNAKRDPSRPRFARVPAGAKTCAFCSMLSSRGFVYSTEVTAGADGNSFHDDCRCMVVPGWGDNPSVPGYDPDAAYEVYLNSVVDGPGGIDLQATLANMRRKQPSMFTDGIGLKVNEVADLPPREWLVSSVKNAFDDAVLGGLNVAERHFDYAKEVLSHVAEVTAKYPEVRGLPTIEFVEVRKGSQRRAGAWVYGDYQKGIAQRPTSLTFNAANQPTQEHMKRMITQKWFHAAEGTDPKKYVTWHEMGHVIDYTSKQTSHSVVRDILHEAVDPKRNLRSDSGLLKRALKQEQISNYGATSISEVIAESFATVETSPDLASSLEKKIHGALIKALRGR